MGVVGNFSRSSRKTYSNKKKKNVFHNTNCPSTATTEVQTRFDTIIYTNYVGMCSQDAKKQPQPEERTTPKTARVKAMNSHSWCLYSKSTFLRRRRGRHRIRQGDREQSNPRGGTYGHTDPTHHDISAKGVVLRKQRGTSTKSLFVCPGFH